MIYDMSALKQEY